MIRTECFEYILRYMSTKEKDLVKAYIKTGNKKQAALMAGYPESLAESTARKILGKTAARKYVKSLAQAAGCKIQWMFEDKLRVLKRITELSVPEEAQTIEEVHPTPAIAAIAESNKMQGHYSAEKIVQTNINVDTDLQQVNDLLEKYKREY